MSNNAVKIIFKIHNQLTFVQKVIKNKLLKMNDLFESGVRIFTKYLQHQGLKEDKVPKESFRVSNRNWIHETENVSEWNRQTCRDWTVQQREFLWQEENI